MSRAAQSSMYDSKVARGFKPHTCHEPRQQTSRVASGTTGKCLATSGGDRSAIISRLAVPSSIIVRWVAFGVSKESSVLMSRASRCGARCAFQCVIIIKETERDATCTWAIYGPRDPDTRHINLVTFASTCTCVSITTLVFFDSFPGLGGPIKRLPLALYAQLMQSPCPPVTCFR